jgi:hypothetical protein
LDSVFYDSNPVIGAEYEVAVCWSGSQKFRVTKVADDDSDDIEVEFVSGKQLYAAPHLRTLSDDEIEKLRVTWLTTQHGSVGKAEATVFARAIEAALKEVK